MATERIQFGDTKKPATREEAITNLTLAAMAIREFLETENSFRDRMKQLSSWLTQESSEQYESLQQALQQSSKKETLSQTSKEHKKEIIEDALRELKTESPFGSPKELMEEIEKFNKLIQDLSKANISDQEIEVAYKQIQEAALRICNIMNNQSFIKDSSNLMVFSIGHDILAKAVESHGEERPVKGGRFKPTDLIKEPMQRLLKYNLLLQDIQKKLGKFLAWQPQEADLQRDSNIIGVIQARLKKIEGMFKGMQLLVPKEEVAQRLTLGKRFSRMVDRVMRGIRRTQSAPTLSTSSTSSTSNKASALPTKPRAMSVGDVTEGKSTDDGKTSQNDERDCKKPGPR